MDSGFTNHLANQLQHSAGKIMLEEEETGKNASVVQSSSLHSSFG